MAKKKVARTATRRSASGIPSVPLETAIKIPRTIFESFGGRPTMTADLAHVLNISPRNPWFASWVKSALQYNLVSKGSDGRLALTSIGKDIVAPTSPDTRQDALLKAFRSIPEFAKVQDYYEGHQLPASEYFVNTVRRRFGVERAERFAEVYNDNVYFLSSFSYEAVAQAVADMARSGAVATAPTRVREFLDTCFVMMPFGNWFDRYYQDIYVPAIRDAEYDPRRADELFSTGSVVEQIWEQIQKSSVLLADLSEKNPNVFYELGLAHAARKPVVFTACRLEDVPFDLRHLRVIIYETREPNWAGKLREDISKYLRGCREEPEKSIPQPFRRPKESS